MEKCSDALYEFEGIDKGVSKRTLQLDIQNMRSEKLGYNAPIVVRNRKYYTYEDPDFSITNLPLADGDLAKLNDAVEILKQFQAFDQFKEMSSLVSKLENKIHTEQFKERSIIHIDKNENLKGLHFINPLYDAIRKKVVLKIEYQSFKARKSNPIHFHPHLLKEFNNRWFIVGLFNKEKKLSTLALDRIIEITEVNDIKFHLDQSFNPDLYYQNVVGVTVNEGMFPRNVLLKIDQRNAPYILTKPLHPSQQVLEKNREGIIVQIHVIPNYELERLILGFGSSLEVIAPTSLRKRIKTILCYSLQQYNKEKE
jgi:predicted DNA-binding transcriptional regulator YafY